MVVVSPSRNPSRRLRMAVCACILALGACEDDAPDQAKDGALGPGTNTAPRNGEFTLTIPVVAQVGQQALACGVSYPGMGLANSTVEFKEFALYVHNVALKNADGAWVPLRMQDDGRWQRDGIALLDFLDQGSPACAESGTQETHTSITGYLAEGSYSAIRFTLGMPASHNHMNAVTAVAPFNRQRMWWSWASGFRYLKADLKVSTVKPGGQVKQTEKYYAHLGGVKCSKDPVTMAYACKDPRLSTIELPLDPTKQGILLNVAALFAQDDLGVGRGCMGGSSLKDHSDPKELVPTSCRPQYLAVGLNTDAEVAIPVGAQSMFRAMVWAGTVPATPVIPPLSEVTSAQGVRNPDYWPRSDYQRAPELDLYPSTSSANGVLSHPVSDPRFGQSCLKCHQSNGPGRGKFEFAGTIFKENGQPYNEGAVELVLSKGKGKWGVQDPQQKVPEATVHMRVPIDANGQFFAPKSAMDSFAQAAGVPPVDYATQSYQAFILNRDGERIMAMAPKKAGSCNQCHTGGFRLVVPSRLMSGPWTPAAGRE